MFLQNYKLKLKELELDYKFKSQELDQILINYKAKKQDEIHKLAQRCASDTAAYEHEYHLAIQIKQTEIARLDALIEAKKETVHTDKVAYERIIAIKDKTIESLTTTIENLVKSLGDFNGTNTVINKNK